MTLKGDLFLKAGGTIPEESDARKVNILLTTINTYIYIYMCVWLHNTSYNICTGTLKILYPQLMRQL